MQHQLIEELSTADLMSAVDDAVKHWVDIANQYLTKHTPYPNVTFRASGKRAGSAFLHQGRLNFHRHLLNAYRQCYFDEVIPHEVAHWAVHCNYGRVKPHGSEWRHVMKNIFGREPQTTHTMDTSILPTQQYTYKCSCDTHYLTTRRHRRIQLKKNRYVCRKCGDELKEAVV